MKEAVTFQVISAQQLPKPEWDKPSSIVDPQVWVEIHGVPIDNMKKKTHHIENNGKCLLLGFKVFYSPHQIKAQAVCLICGGFKVQSFSPLEGFHLSKYRQQQKGGSCCVLQIMAQCLLHRL